MTFALEKLETYMGRNVRDFLTWKRWVFPPPWMDTKTCLYNISAALFYILKAKERNQLPSQPYVLGDLFVWRGQQWLLFTIYSLLFQIP